MRYAGRTRFSFADFLVVVAVITVCVQLILPALIRARDASRRDRCLQKVRFLTLAMENYDSAHGSFPPGVPSCTNDDRAQLGTQSDPHPMICAGPNWAMQILDLVEEIELSKTVKGCMSRHLNAIDDCVAEEDGELSGVGHTTPAFMLCPNASKADQLHQSKITKLESLSKGNYAGGWGANDFLSWHPSQNPDADGHYNRGLFGVVRLQNRTRMNPNGQWLFGRGKGTRRSELVKGTAKTLAISEVTTLDHPEDIRGVWVGFTPGSALFTGRYTPNSIQSDNTASCDGNNPGSVLPPAHPLSCTQANPGEEHASARSAHTGGVVAGFADGHASFISDGIDPSVWRNLSTIHRQK